MKALEKDRNRRYETANGFAADVQRYLSGEAVQAVPPSASYRLRKFARKNRAMLLTAAAFAGLLIAAAGVSSWLAVKARTAETVADERRAAADENAKRAQNNAEEAGYLLGRLQVSVEEQVLARLEATLLAQSLQVDVDLTHMQSDHRVGLLRLIQRQQVSSMSIPTTQTLTLSRGPSLQIQLPEEVRNRQRTLQDFVTAVVLTKGQESAPLLPPITHDGIPVSQSDRQLSPNQQTLLTWGADGTVRLWDVWTARPIAILRRGTEKIVHQGYNTDGQTVFTLDDTGVIHFWDATDGLHRAEVQLPSQFYAEADNEEVNKQIRETQLDYWHPKTIDRNACIIVGKDRMITRHVVVKQRPDTGNEKVLDQLFSGPVELWDTTTGRSVAQLDVPDAGLESLQFLGAGRWLAVLDNSSRALILSPEDGRVITRLTHAEGSVVTGISASPSNQRVATRSQDTKRAIHELSIWDADSWTRIATTTVPNDFPWIRFSNDELLFSSEPTDIDGYVWNIYHVNALTTPVARFGAHRLVPPVDHLILRDMGTVIDTKTGLRLTPPSGQRFHPSLAKFALDGRFVVGCGVYGNMIIDTLCEKQFDADVAGMLLYQTAMGHVCVLNSSRQSDTFIRRIPAAGQLDIPTGHLELWTQVAVRGELGPEGEFVKWDEETWEQKRRALAALPAQEDSFPFPGYVATDKLHWLRAEYRDAHTGADKLRWASELLLRAEASGDQNEAARWRAEKVRLSSEPKPGEQE